MIGEFYKHEHLNGRSLAAANVSFQGSSEYIVKNAPLKQRQCKCKDCGIKIVREVPRIEFRASYHYQAGHYCPECGLKRIIKQRQSLQDINAVIEREIKVALELEKGLKEVINDEWYPNKMALGKMFGVMKEGRERPRY